MSPTSTSPKGRHKFTVEFEPRDGMTIAESLDWIQKNFDFFHPGMRAKVLGKPEVIQLEGMDLI